MFKAASPPTPTAHQRPTPYRRRRFVGWTIAYALAIAYSSLVLGPEGFHYVALDPDAAWRTFKATPYLVTGSDQRPDWIANLLMLIPLGFLATGMFWPRRESKSRWLAAGVALCCCLSFVLIIKYLQIFFPPRTVSLNYITAQVLGSLLGIALFWVSSRRLPLVLREISGHGRRSLMIWCGVYSVIVVLFLLFPFDFVLSAEDLRQRAAVLPKLLFSWPGEGRSTTLLVGVVLADTAATVPLGVLLALGSRRISLFRIAVAGFLITAAVTLLTGCGKSRA